MIVCLLATYRSNGPYNQLMHAYRRLAPGFPGVLAGLHVITLVPERTPEHDYWCQEEDRVARARLPFEMLIDDEEVTWTVMPPSSPWCCVIGKDRRILSEGDLTDVEFWEALGCLAASAPAPRPDPELP